jgi:Asp-tRNA(Asn)/Glu-tRNA(Gln) amidotransferase A subunit family amidase
VRIAEARTRARALDHLNAFISLTDEQGEGPVVAVKDLIDVRGSVTTGGGAVLPDVPAERDAAVVARLRRHGVVVVGKTNLHEWAFGATSRNVHHGDVLNPRDASRFAGGSSGGSAVAVVGGACDWAIGTDTGGSIRIPASLCGVVGLKPTRGTLPLDGVIPLAASLDTVGPLAPDVATAAVALELLSNGAVPARAGVPDRAPVLAIPTGWIDDLDRPTETAWTAFSQGLPEIALPSREDLAGPALTVLYVEAARYHAAWLAEDASRYSADLRAKLGRGLELPDADRDEALAVLAERSAAVEAAMAGVDALVLPATACVAPRLDEPEPRDALTRFTRPFNGTGQPVVTLPLAVEGLPVGIQLVGRRGQDAALLSVALWVERGISAAFRSTG